jgi:hypothetical protein
MAHVQMSRTARRLNKLESQRVNRLLPYYWYKLGLGTTHLYTLRVSRIRKNGDWLVQITDQIRFASESDRIVSAQGVTFQRDWTETLNNSLYALYSYQPTEEDLHEAIAAVFNTDRFMN